MLIKVMEVAGTVSLKQIFGISLHIGLNEEERVTK